MLFRSMSFSIVLNSSNYFTNTNNQVVVYSYDFTNMEQGRYEVQFSYRGKQNHLNGNDLALVYIDFGGFRKVFEAELVFFALRATPNVEELISAGVKVPAPHKSLVAP